MNKYTAISKVSWKQEGGCNGYGGKMVKTIVAATLNPQGRMVKVFNDLKKAQEWADFCNENFNR